MWDVLTMAQAHNPLLGDVGEPGPKMGGKFEAAVFGARGRAIGAVVVDADQY